MAKKTKIQSDIEAEAIRIVDTERTNWEDAVCYITENVGFRMRPLIRTLRKNYWGVFDQPIDPVTGQEKAWIPQAMTLVEDIWKNIDIDQKDITFKARRPKGYAITELTRAGFKEYLSNMYFGEILDEDQRSCIIDGTVVWKTWEDKSDGEVKLKRRTVDLLHVYIDPTEDNIQSAYRFTERGLFTPDQIKGMTGWMNRDTVGVENLDRNDSRKGARAYTKTTAKLVDVWECWGKIPKWLITGDKKADDAYTEIDGHIVISGLDGNGPLVHLIEQNTKKDKFGNVLKPYEEWRPCKITGRWYGLGFVERILTVQELLNVTANIRINRNRVSQLGLFKIVKGKGITPKMLARLPVNGAIEVQNPDDITQFNVQPMDATSYKDEEVYKEWAIKVTGAYPISSGDTMPSSTSATASAIANTNAKSSYSMFKESTGFFIERWADRHALPIFAKTLDVDDIVRLSSDDEGFKAIVERVVAQGSMEELDALYEKGQIPTEEQVLNAMQIAEDKMMKQPQMFVKAVEKIIAESLDTKVRITNEDLDTSVTVSNLITLAGIQITPQNEPIVKDIYDLLGLPQPRFPKAQQPQQPQGQPIPQQNLQQMTQMAQSPING